jgi:hypothetical protein
LPCLQEQSKAIFAVSSFSPTPAARQIATHTKSSQRLWPSRINTCHPGHELHTPLIRTMNGKRRGEVHVRLNRKGRDGESHSQEVQNEIFLQQPIPGHTRHRYTDGETDFTSKMSQPPPGLCSSPISQNKTDQVLHLATWVPLPAPTYSSKERSTACKREPNFDDILERFLLPVLAGQGLLEG